MSNPVWAIMPVLAGPEMTEAALSDLLAQSLPVRVLVINQGVDSRFREHLEQLAEQDNRILLWSHQPPLPSLSATWNRALDYVCGELKEVAAFVVNNDVRLHRQTIELLCGVMAKTDAYLVSAVGVTPDQFAAFSKLEVASTFWTEDLGTKGGPDFSCFLIGADCFAKYRFDEHFIPAFCEDLDYHRRLMLAGDGSRIFSINLPYLHLASQTLKLVDPDQATAIKRSIEIHSRTYYAQKWGGPVNAETFLEPFGGPGSRDGLPGLLITDGSATTPALQRALTGPPIADLARRLLALDDVMYHHPEMHVEWDQEKQDGQDTGSVEPDGRPDPTSETARPEGD